MLLRRWLVVVILMAWWSAPAPAFADGSWIEAGGAWNAPGAAIPSAPPPILGRSNRETCEDLARAPESPEDEAVASAGWLLAGTYTASGNVSLVLASVDYDEDCRPAEYQVFTFDDGTFVGTLAPRPMHHAMDGALEDMVIGADGGVIAFFARFGEDDADCCPSARSSVRYAIDRSAATPVLVPAEAITAATGASSSGVVEIDRRPRVRLAVPSDRVQADTAFEIEVEASDVDGLQRIWWYAEGTDDESLKEGREVACNQVLLCRGSWQVSTPSAGGVTILARAVDIDGRESEVARSRVRVQGDTPRLELTVSDDKVDTGAPLRVTLRASDGDGLDKIWFWSPDSTESGLRRIREQRCDNGSFCERTWDLYPTAVGAITIQAQARDGLGNQSEVQSYVVRVFNTDPTVSLEAKDTRIDRGSRARFTVDAHDIDGVASIRVSILGSDGAELFTETTDCRGRERCRHSYEPRPDVTGTVRIRVKARDARGKETEWVETTLRVR